MEYLKRAMELSKTSFEAGEFPAGSVLVSKSGNIYESKPSLPHNHSEMMVIDMAVEKEGAPLNGAVVYASMQSCLMCIGKMYWAGITEVHYIVPKKDVRANYGYESEVDPDKISSELFRPITMTQHSEYLNEALGIYQKWVDKIENSA